MKTAVAILAAIFLMACGQGDSNVTEASAVDESTLTISHEEQQLRIAMEGIDFQKERPDMNLSPEEEKAYLQGYLKILRSELPLVSKWSEQQEYYKDLYAAGTPYRERLESKNESAFPYGIYYDDLDGDGRPELALLEGVCLYVIKYEPGDEQGRIVWDRGDATENAASLFMGFMETGVWFRYENGQKNMTDCYDGPDASGEWTRQLWLERGMRADGQYYEITVRGQETVPVNGEIWTELTESFYSATGNLLQSKSLAEVFGEELDETDPLLAEWDGPREYEYMEFDENVNLPYVSESVYEVLKEAYDGIDFYGELETGDTSLYGEYLEKYHKLLQDGGSVLNKETGEEIPVTDFREYLGYNDWSELYYYFFDMDQDAQPELIIDDARGCYIIDYNSEKTEFSLWYPSMAGSRFLVLGSGKLCWNGNSSSRFCQLDREGEEELELQFWRRAISARVQVCLIALPNYKEADKKITVTEEMKQNGFYVRSAGQWYFRVTENQYNELTHAYWEAYHDYGLVWWEKRYSYEELFDSQLPPY